MPYIPNLEMKTTFRLPSARAVRGAGDVPRADLVFAMPANPGFIRWPSR